MWTRSAWSSHAKPKEMAPVLDLRNGRFRSVGGAGQRSVHHAGPRGALIRRYELSVQVTWVHDKRRAKRERLTELSGRRGLRVAGPDSPRSTAVEDLDRQVQPVAPCRADSSAPPPATGGPVSRQGRRLTSSTRPCSVGHSHPHRTMSRIARLGATTGSLRHQDACKGAAAGGSQSDRGSWTHAREDCRPPERRRPSCQGSRRPGQHAAVKPFRLGAGCRPVRPGRPAGGAEPHPRAGPGAGPARPDDGLPVHLLPRRREDHGRRPGRHPHRRPGCATVRDAHLSNFGGFASPERRLLFDLNDFDETLPGPFEYDVKRMAASFTIAARNNGFTRPRAGTPRSQVRAYREAMLSSPRWAPWTCGTPTSPRTT